MSFQLDKKQQVQEILKCGKDPSYFLKTYARISHPMHGLISFDTYGMFGIQPVWGDEFLKRLRNEIPDIVYIYSQNSAKSFLNIIKKYGLIDLWMDTNLMCLGDKTSTVLNEIKWKKIFLFNSGEEEFLLYKI